MIDAGTDAGTATPDPVPMLEMACPEGWRARTLYEASICEPFPADEGPSCPEGQMAVLGQPAGSECQPVWPCPIGEWPDDAPADAVYVRIDGTGDGTREAPMGNLEDALDVARARRVAVVIGEGEYFGSYNAGLVPLVLGLCPTRTILRTGVSHALTVLNGTTEVRGLALRADTWLGLDIGENAVIRLTGVSVVGGVNAIRMHPRAVLEADHVLIRGPAVADHDFYQTAVEIQYGARATIHHADISGDGGAIGVPLMTEDPVPEDFGTFELEDAYIHDVPYGLIGPADGTMRRVAIERAPIAAMVVPYRSVTMEDVRIRDIGETVYRGLSVGLIVAHAALTLRRTSLTHMRGTSIAILAREGISTTLDAEDLFVADTDGVLNPDFDDHIALLVSGTTASANVRRAHFAEIHGNGLQVEHGELTVTDVRVIDTHPVGATWGHALQAYDGTLNVTRADVRPGLFGLFVVDRSVATVSHFTQRGGRNVQVQCGVDCPRDETVLSLSNASIRDVLQAGILVTDATVHLTDVDIRGVRAAVLPIEIDDVAPSGLVVVSSTATGERVHVSDVTGIGVLAHDAADVALSSVRVEDIRSVDCACGPSAYGDGFLWSGGATVSLTDFEAIDVERAGLVAALDFGTPILTGWVRHSGVGLITDPRTPVDLSVFAGVQFEDNDLSTLASPVEVGVTDMSSWRFAPVAVADPSGIGF